MKDLEDKLFSPTGRWVLIGVGAVLGGLLIFHAGTVVGYNRAFRFHGAPREFSVQMMGGMPGFNLPQSFIPEGHGIVGVIQSAQGSLLTIAAPDGDLVPIYVSSSTQIRNDAGDASSSALMPQQSIVILGTPDDQGRINAQFIRIVK